MVPEWTRRMTSLLLAYIQHDAVVIKLGGHRFIRSLSVKLTGIVHAHCFKILSTFCDVWNQQQRSLIRPMSNLSAIWSRFNRDR